MVFCCTAPFLGGAGLSVLTGYLGFIVMPVLAPVALLLIGRILYTVLRKQIFENEDDKETVENITKDTND